jgi:hypothetical protein
MVKHSLCFMTIVIEVMSDMFSTDYTDVFI